MTLVPFTPEYTSWAKQFNEDTRINLAQQAADRLLCEHPSTITYATWNKPSPYPYYIRQLHLRRFWAHCNTSWNVAS